MTDYVRIPIREDEHKRLMALQTELTGKIDSYLTRPSLSDVIKELLDRQEAIMSQKTIVHVDEQPYTLTRDWLDQYDLYDGETHLGTFHFSSGHDQSRGYANGYGVNSYLVTYVGEKLINEHESTVQAACQRIVKENDHARRPETGTNRG